MPMPDHLPATHPAPSLLPVRLGIHGSPGLARRIVAQAGLRDEDVRWVPYDVSAPFRELSAGEADVMVVKYEVREPGLAVSRPVLHDGRAAIVGAHHPLARRASVSLDELADYDGFRCPGSFPSYVWDRVVPPHTPSGRPIRRIHPMTTVDEMAAVLARTDAVHISFQSLDALVPPGIAVVPVHDMPPAPVALCWLRNAGLPPHAARFVAAAEAGALPC